MVSDEDKVPVKRSSGKVEELSAEELEQINYERKVRDQESTGRLVTPKQVNIFAVILCLVVLVYAIPRMFFSEREETSTYIPLSERHEKPEYAASYELAQPLSSLSIQAESPELTITANTSDENEGSSADALARLKEQERALKQAERQSNVEDRVKQWAEDWSRQNIEAYLSHYSDRFVSDKGMNIEQWREYRSDRLAKPEWIQVLLLDIEVTLLSDSTAIATFTQNYSASNYQEVSTKKLELETSANAWKIVSETSQN